MPVQSFSFQLKTRGFSDVHDLTSKVRDLLKSSGLTQGIVTVFVPGSTAGITTIEFERGVIEDLKRAIERIAPQNIHYDHDARWGDGNGFSHVRAALLGPSLTIPFTQGKLQLGTWQQIILIDFDNRPRHREILVQVVGE
ncbi:MAG TPA: secondary thiamine-phosphate synthase enzyme YjbQ [Candidatus Limnocylindrales bacterium]|nr:secondary thiamine-phosphate synthase enzyme YjbQ [Candidatus Limnocylindrales bacterium]